jgi:hypothetical protein
MDTMEFLMGLSDENLKSLPYMIKAEQQRRYDEARYKDHQCESLYDIQRCPICSIP